MIAHAEERACFRAANLYKARLHKSIRQQVKSELETSEPNDQTDLLVSFSSRADGHLDASSVHA
eukprot:5302705-Lingulodinium_polyedra.AAC.1